MGVYINTGNAGFRSVLRHEYIDKTPLIAAVNNMLFSEGRYMCVTRCRRFGKSMAAKMLCAYYDRSVDSPAIVLELKYNKDADAAIDQIHRRQYPAKVAEYADDLLLVGINYDREQKTHTVKIEKL